MKIFKSKSVFLYTGIAVLALTFQNCAREGFKSLESSSSQSTIVASESDTGSASSGTEKQNSAQSNQSSSSSGSSGSSGSSQFPTGQVREPASPSTPNVKSPIQLPTTPVPSTPEPLSPAPPTPPLPLVNTSSVTYNFVAGDSNSCDLSVADYLRTKLTSGAMSVVAPRCKIGGGCGLSCGKPNGTSCLSANPNAYGACLVQSDFDTYTVYNMQAYSSQSNFNFVAANQNDCSNSIQERHRYSTGSNTKTSVSCKMGGGCGISCGKPNGTSCLSANPNVMGACFGYDEFKNL